MPHYAVTAVGPDQPGILAALTRPLAELSCNLEDTSAAILGGHFMLVMVVRAPAGLKVATIVREVEDSCSGFQVRVDVRAIADTAGPPPPATHVLSAYGADRPGLIHRLAELLAARGVNLLELDTRLVGRAGRPVYAMLIEAALPASLAAAELRRDLETLGRELGVDVSLRPIEER